MRVPRALDELLDDRVAKRVRCFYGELHGHRSSSSGCIDDESKSKSDASTSKIDCDSREFIEFWESAPAVRHSRSFVWVAFSFLGCFFLLKNNKTRTKLWSPKYWCNRYAQAKKNKNNHFSWDPLKSLRHSFSYKIPFGQYFPAGFCSFLWKQSAQLCFALSPKNARSPFLRVRKNKALKRALSAAMNIWNAYSLRKLILIAA